MKRLWLLPVLFGASLAAAAPAPPAPYVARYYNDGYQVFVGAGNLARARQVIRNALHWRPDDPLWLKRQALVAGWQGDTEASLAAWQRLAEKHNSQEAWQHVLQLAPLTFNDDLVLKARRRLLRLHPDDARLVEEVAREYELLGRPRDGIAFLEKWRHQHPSRAALMALQRMAQGTGQDLRAAGYDRDYMRRYGPTEKLAIHCADLLWLHGKREKAFKGLQQDAAGLAYSPSITRRLAVMATQLGDWREALNAYATLTDKGDADPSDGYQYLTLAHYQAPQRVPEILGKLWRDTRDPKFALSYLYAVNDRGDTAAVGAFIKGLTPEQLEQLGQDPAFLRLYANYLEGRGRPGRARALLRQALTLAPDDSDTREAWLWLLIDQGDDHQLAADLTHWEPALRRQARYFNVLSAAHMALGQAEQALRYQREMLKADPESWKQRWAFCQALLAAGRQYQAWSLLRQLWRRPPALNRVEPADKPLYDEMRAALAARFGSGDDQLRFQRRELARTPPAERGRRAEWLAQWALGKDAPDLARLWYLREKRWSGGKLPPESALALANLNNDHLAIADLRDRHGGRLTADERIQADDALGRERQAAAELARQQHDAPALADANPNLDNLLLPASPAFLVNGERRHLGPLDADLFGFRARTPFGERWDWTLDLQQQHFASNDRRLLTVNRTGRRVAFGLHRRGRLWDSDLEIGERSVFGHTQPDATLTLGGQPLARWHWQWRGEWGAPSDETAELLLAGRRTGQSLELQWSPAQTWQNSASVAGYRYRDMAGHRLGHGTLFNVQSTWRPWLSSPSPGLRLRQTVARFGGQQPLGPGIDVNEAGRPAAVPQSYNETELALLFGRPDAGILPHRLNAWGELGVTRNNLYGTGFAGRLGAEGPLLGGDAWRLFLEKSINTGGANQDSYRLGFEYRFYY